MSDADRAYLAWQSRWLSTARPEQVPPDGDWTELGVLAGRGFGKLLALDTPVPTPSGWATMGSLQIGDVVYDEQGRHTRVLKVFDAVPQAAYRLTFSDGSTIDACDEHQWVTWTHRDRKQWSRYSNAEDFPEDWAGFVGHLYDAHRNVTGTYSPQVRTTQQLVDTLRVGKRGDLNHCIPTAAPLQAPTADLPVDPHTLGLWLGNGHTRSGELSMHPDDVAHTRAVVPLSTSEPRDKGKTFTVYGLGPLLRAQGLLGNKHIPALYLRASAEQRVALLRGLMDSDGGVDNASSVSFSSTLPNLADGVFELAASLGEKPRIEQRQTYFRAADGSRKAGLPSWRVLWTPGRLNPFSTPRKAQRVRLHGSQSKRNRHRMLVSAEPLDRAPMRCITVDSPSSLFLVGRSMIPTHNTRVGAEWLGRSVYEDPSGLPSYVICPTLGDVKRVAFGGESGLLSVVPHELIVATNMTDLTIHMRNCSGGTSLIQGFGSENYERLRGPQGARAWCDELAAWVYAEETWDMMQMGLRLGPLPQVMWTTTPKPRDIVRKLTKPQDGRIIVRGSTYDNRANLPQSFFKQLEQYEGTRIGRQELHGEMIDPEESGIIKRSWLRLWPAKTPLPRFDWIIMSLDTAFTEKTLDKKGDPDPTACSVWGVFTHEKRSNVMLLDCWEEHLGMPELIRKVKREMNVAYGDDSDQALIKPLFGSSKPLTSGRKPDILLIEDKGSGISLRQMLAESGIEAYAYNPGRADKLSRLHIVSPVFAQKRVWMPESEKHEGRPRTWAEPLITQICAFTGEGSIKHDDHVDTATQALRLCLDKGLINMLPPPKRDQVDTPPPKRYVNPYSQ